MSQCKFHSEQVYYGSEAVDGTTITPTGQLSLVWDTNTGAPIHLEWTQGGIRWSLCKDGYPGRVIPEAPGSYYYDIDLRISTQRDRETAFNLKGKLTVDAHRPSGATLATICEGNSADWVVANGILIFCQANID